MKEKLLNEREYMKKSTKKANKRMVQRNTYIKSIYIPSKRAKVCNLLLCRYAEKAKYIQ